MSEDGETSDQQMNQSMESGRWSIINVYLKPGGGGWGATLLRGRGNFKLTFTQ